MKSMSLLIFLFAISSAFASEAAVFQVPKNLNDQYKALSSECDLVDGFRVMKLYKMDQLWKTIQDSLHKKQMAIQDLQAIATAQRGEMATLKNLLGESNKEQASLASAVDNLQIFGGYYSKAGFVAVMLIVLAVLVASAIVLYIMYRVAFSNAHEFRIINESLNKEFDDYKHQAVEKQIKLSRELQNYRNRMSELKSA